MSVEIKQQSARRTRLVARIPRVAAMVLVIVLSLAGLRVVIAGPAQSDAPVPRSPVQRYDVQSFAEAFVRVYLTFDSANPDARERELTRFLSEGLDARGGYTPPDRGSESVRWTSIAADRSGGQRQRLVTVAAQTDRRVVYLVVSVVQGADGLLVVSRYPAVVGPPSTDTSYTPSEEDEVEDSQLRSVTRRAVRNYLAGEQANLLADLSPDASLSLPAERLIVQSVDAITRAGSTQVAVQVTARDADGGVLTLRYQLSVVKRERWYVRAIEGDLTTSQGG